jgi:hypothetical protein
MPRLSSLSLTACLRISDEGLIALAQHCKFMHSLTLNGCVAITDEGVCAIAKGLSQTLSLLHLDGCAAISDKSIVAVSQHTGFRLLSLSLGGCCLITDESLLSFAEHNTSITFLDLSHCDDVSDIGVEAINEHCCELVALSLYCMSKPSFGAIGRACKHEFGRDEGGKEGNSNSPFSPLGSEAPQSPVQILFD